MNEFTKKELEDVLLIYKTFCNDVDGISRSLTNLEDGILKKLQSMIDNYCEHKDED